MALEMFNLIGKSYEIDNNKILDQNGKALYS